MTIYISSLRRFASKNPFVQSHIPSRCQDWDPGERRREKVQDKNAWN